MKNFIIIGNGSTGTSWLYKTLNKHTKLKGDFEYFNSSFKTTLDEMLNRAVEANKNGKIYFNKIPFEQTIIRFDCWKKYNFVELSKHFHIIFCSRAITSWAESWHRRQEIGCAQRKPQEMVDRYLIGWSIYLDILEMNPDKVILSNFERRLIAFETEIKYICDFAGVEFEEAMLSEPPKKEIIQRDKPVFCEFYHD